MGRTQIETPRNHETVEEDVGDVVEADEVAAYDGHHIASYAVRTSTTRGDGVHGGLNVDFHAGCTSTAPRSCAATEL